MSVSGRLERWLVIDDDPLPTEADVAIGVGIDVSKDLQQASPYSAAVARMCAEMLLSGRVKYILFTGGNPPGDTVKEAQAMLEVIQDDVPRNKIFVEIKSQRTWMNADYTLAIMKEHGWQTAIVVAQQLHAERVKATFKKRWRGSGLQFSIFKAWSDYGGGSQSRLDSFWKFALWDTIAYIVSILKGYV